jgi:competence protein ComEA
MRVMTRAGLAVPIFGVVFLGATVAATSRSIRQEPPPAAQGAADRFPDTTGKVALLKVCSNCHSAESVVQSLRTRQEWSDVVDQMSRYGAEASDQEFDQILSYLVRHFSPIRINKATAKELESTLDVPGNVAEAIVAFRAEKGDFKTLEEVKGVPGVEAGKLDRQKARLVF